MECNSIGFVGSDWLGSDFDDLGASRRRHILCPRGERP
jgi:hypothetical protein